MAHRSYCLITPCRDEEQYARRTLESVAAQTVPPALWVIVDDGSRDKTPQILEEYAAKLPYLRVVRQADRGFRKLGGGVIDAFYAGYETVDPNEFQYLCKLDLDLELPPTYFESMMRRMEANPRLGTCSGKPFFHGPDGKSHAEVCGDENSVGMAKFYRVECFQQIGGFVRELMWDGIDCHRCRMLGWIAESVNDPAVRFEHLRPMGTSHKSWWTGRVRHGVGQWYMGTIPLYMVASGLFRLFHPPMIIGSVGMWWGYFKSMMRRRPRYEDADFRRFLRRYQWLSLLGGKQWATKRVDRQRAERWNAELKPVG